MENQNLENTKNYLLLALPLTWLMFRITIPPRTILAELPGAFPTCYDLFIVVLVIHRILNGAVLWEQVPYFSPYLFVSTRPDQKLQ